MTESQPPTPPTGDPAGGSPLPSGSPPPGGSPLPAGTTPPTGAPTWQPPADPAVTAKRSWYKRPVFIVPIVIVVVLIVLVAVFANSNHSDALQKAIQRDGQRQLQAKLSQVDPGATLKLTNVDCTESGSTQNYSCVMHETVTGTSGTVQTFVQDATGSCSGTQCQWHTTDNPQSTSKASGTESQ